MSSFRVAMFFDHRYSHTTGHYFKKILDETGPTDVFLPQEAHRLRPGSHDLYLCVDDSTHHLFPARLRPSALWVIDTHMTYRADRIVAQAFDYVFAANKGGAARLRKDGITSATWLPLAFDPELHGRRERAKVFPVAFIGGDWWGRRRRLLEKLRGKYPDAFISTAPHTEIGLIYSQAKIVFNCGIKDDLNMRVFEAMGSGSCLVTNSDTDGLDELFVAGKHFATYSSEAEALAVVEDLLKNEEARETIARAGREEALARHTYRHRLETILSVVRGSGAPNIGRDPLSPALSERTLRLLERWYRLETRFSMVLP